MRLQFYIRPVVQVGYLLALMEFADPRLIFREGSKATVDELVRRNEAAARKALASLTHNVDTIDRATRVLADAFAQPAYLAELELWAVARADPQLRAALRAAERRARRDLDRVISDLLAPLQDRPAYAVVVALTTEFVRGLALAGVLRSDRARRGRLLDEWIWAVRILLEQQPNAPISLSDSNSGTNL
jgi:hypothetical protein